MNKKKNIKKSSTKKPVQRSSNRAQNSDGYTPKRIPSGMTKIGVGSDGVEVYSATPQIMNQYYPDLYALAPGQPGYVFTGSNGVYTPIGQSNHAYDEIIKNNPVIVKTSPAQSNSQPSDNTELSTYSDTPASNPYNVNDPFLQERFRQQFWNNGGRDIWLKQADAKARALTPTLGTFATLAWKPIEAVLPSNLVGTIGKQIRDFDLSRLPSDWLGSGFGGGNLGFTEVSDATANWAERNPEANSLINLAGNMILSPSVATAVNQGFRAVSPSTYIPGRAGTIADLGLFGGLAVKPVMNAVEDPTVGNIIVAGGSALPAIVPAFKTLRFAKDILPRTYNTNEGNIFGSRFGNAVIGVDASGRNIYGTFVPPIKTGRVSGKPKYIEVFGNENGNIIPLDKVRQSIEYGVPLKYNGKTLKDVYLDETTGVVRAKFGGRNLEFYTEEPIMNIEDGVTITNKQGRYTLGSDMPTNEQMVVTGERNGVPTVRIAGRDYAINDPAIQDMNVSYDDYGLQYNGPVSKIAQRVFPGAASQTQPISEPSLTMQPSDNLLEVPLEFVNGNDGTMDFFIDESEFIPGRRVRLADGDTATLESLQNDNGVKTIRITRSNGQWDVIRVKSPEATSETNIAPESNVQQNNEPSLTRTEPENQITSEEAAENNISDENLDTETQQPEEPSQQFNVTDDNGFINDSNDIGFRPENDNIRVARMRGNVSNYNSSMIESVVYKGKRMEVTRDGDISILTDPTTNEEITLTDNEVMSLKRSGELTNPKYTESFEYYTNRNRAYHPDDVWGGVRQDLPARISKNRSKAGTVQDAYDYMHRPKSNVSNWAYKVAGGIAGLGGLGALITWLANRNGSVPIDPHTGEPMTKEYNDSVRRVNKIIGETLNIDTLNMNKIPEFSGQDQSQLGGQSNEINANDSTNYIERGDTVLYDDGSYILKSDPTKLYKIEE